MTNHPASANHNHIDHIDLLRIVAAFLVIVNHTNSRVFLSNAPSLTWFSSLTYFFVSKIAVPLFLLIMGALLLGKQDSTHKSISRFLRILIVGFVFSIVYFVFYHRHDLSINLVPEFLIQVWRGPITNAYWYLYLYLGLLLILPLLQRMAAAFSRAHIQYLVFISVIIVGTYPLFSIFFPYRPSSYFFASLFSTDIGLLFAGYYIERFM